MNNNSKKINETYLNYTSIEKLSILKPQSKDYILYFDTETSSMDQSCNNDDDADVDVDIDDEFNFIDLLPFPSKYDQIIGNTDNEDFKQKEDNFNFTPIIESKMSFDKYNSEGSSCKSEQGSRSSSGVNSDKNINNHCQLQSEGLI
jgi:hypothetical protein